MNKDCIKKLVQLAFNGCLRAQIVLARRYGIITSIL